MINSSLSTYIMMSVVLFLGLAATLVAGYCLVYRQVRRALTSRVEAEDLEPYGDVSYVCSLLRGFEGFDLSPDVGCLQKHDDAMLDEFAGEATHEL